MRRNQTWLPSRSGGTFVYLRGIACAGRPRRSRSGPPSDFIGDALMWGWRVPTERMRRRGAACTRTPTSPHAS
ncbi:MAG: hypothetical protein AVDCRST_MAG26-83 [uncultured Chloroflexia bacterium]|uniref:Uncharacterized protein n=1 Tax=uncultured Chloroflexia bacterium TaxID=1672391 RepID=A0A6J4H1P1_9CHLR|nr:MAG: hypothetical protein AVDCRST_MAG26-83 [uncultured Chloroflexia bacterium]